MNISYVNQPLSSSSGNGKYYMYLFLFWPFLAFIAALTNYSQKESRKVVYIFLIYYGLTFAMGGIGNDAERYAMQFEATAKLPFSYFFKILGGMYSSDTSVDIVEPFITFVVSRFSSYYGVLFAAYAAVFGFFYLRSINLLHDRYLKNPGLNSFIFMALFVMLLPITAINGFRMWTAAWIFFYAAYHVILFRDRRFILLALASSFVHWSFLSANMVLLIYFFLGNRNLLYIPIAIASFVVPHFLIPIFQAISGSVGGGIQSRFNMYSDESYILGREEAFEEVAWFMQVSYDLLFYYLLSAVVLIKLSTLSRGQGKAEKNLFSFTLLFLAFVNFGKAIPSFGSRFEIIFYMLATLYIFLYFLKEHGNGIHFISVAGLFPMLLYVAIVFRQGSDSINAWLFSPGMGSPLLVPGLPLADILFH